MKILFVMCLCLLLMASCKKESLSLTQHDITTIAGPSTGSTQTPAVIKVTYPYSDGCQYIGRFEETHNGNTVTIKAYTKPVSKEAICTMEAGFRTIDYNFKAKANGNYQLRFVKRDGSFIVHQITVQ